MHSFSRGVGLEADASHSPVPPAPPCTSSREPALSKLVASRIFHKGCRVSSALLLAQGVLLLWPPGPANLRSIK